MSGIPIARLLGFEIRVHWSWVLILALIAVSIATEIGRVDPTSDLAIRWGLGLLTAFAFLGIALAHELGHAVVARRAGMPGGPVIVYFFGGAAGPALEASRPRDEVASALAGPLVSLALGGALLAIAGLATVVGGELSAMIGQAALVVGLMSLILGAVNLIPAFPLDGGRVARGLAWARTGDPERALRFTASLGRRIGYVLAGSGALVVLADRPIDGLMLVLGGWFLVSSARTVDRSAEIDNLLEGVRVGDVMEREVNGVPPGLTLDTFGEQLLDGTASSPVPVLHDEELVGMVGVRQVRGVRRSRWPTTHAGDLMVPADTVPTVSPETTLRSAIEQLRRSGLEGLPVLDGGALTGIITRRAVADAVRERARQRLGAPG
jgi:Zn-dependent protease